MRASLKYFAVIAVCTLASGAGLQSVEAHLVHCPRRRPSPMTMPRRSTASPFLRGSATGG